MNGAGRAATLEPPTATCPCFKVCDVAHHPFSLCVKENDNYLSQQHKLKGRKPQARNRAQARTLSPRLWR